MVKVIIGKRGIGKTKKIIDMANNLVKDCKGNVVFIDDDKKHMYDFKRDIRFISADDFNLKDPRVFYGFLCGVISEDYDIDTIFVDGLTEIVGKEIEKYEELFDRLDKLSEQFKFNLIITINHEGPVPSYLEKYLMEI